MSKYVDFVYGPRQMYSPEAFPHDHYIMDNAPYRFVANLPKDDFMAIPVNRRTANATTPLKVAVVGSPVKISAPFLDLLEQLQNEADFDIHFSFHLGSVGLDTLCFSQTLKERYRNVSYTGYKSYREYLAALGDADIVLNPFPFGHTNTLIDAMLLGIPCLGLQGAEPASKTEAYILDILGYEDAFSAHTVQDYKDKFFKMSQKIMAGEMPIIDRSAVYDTLYSHHQSYDFGKVIKWVYDNRERLLVSDKKAFEAFSP